MRLDLLRVLHGSILVDFGRRLLFLFFLEGHFLQLVIGDDESIGFFRWSVALRWDYSIGSFLDDFLDRWDHLRVKITYFRFFVKVFVFCFYSIASIVGVVCAGIETSSIVFLLIGRLFSDSLELFEILLEHRPFVF